MLRFMLAFNCNTKISEKSDMTKSWALGFAACHKQELFVAQELINKVKIKVLRNLGRILLTLNETTIMGRTKFSQHEIDIIAMLLRRKSAGTRFQQKAIRHQLRVNFEFNISDFNEPGKAFGDEELRQAIRRGAIQILDDATIAAMKEKRARDKARDEAAREQEALNNGATDWKEALKEWEAWKAADDGGKDQT